MLMVCRDRRGRWCVLKPGGRVYGRYRTVATAQARLAQLLASHKHEAKETAA